MKNEEREAQEAKQQRKERYFLEPEEKYAEVFRQRKNWQLSIQAEIIGK